MTSCGSSGSTSKTVENRSKSCDTVCTNSSCFFKRRKPVLPYNLRPQVPKTTGNVVRQRVLSAKLQKVRSLQSQLNDANFHLAELIRENQALKTLQKRQDKALAKYENSNADLPRLLHQHEEEIRTLTEKNKTLKKNLKDTSNNLKIKEEELTRAKEQLVHLENLNKDKRLIEREKLLEKVEDLQFRLKKSDEQIAQLNKRLMLETKNSKHRLNAEISKNKISQREIIQAMTEIDRLTRLLESRDVSPSKKNGILRGANRQSVSLVNLNRNSSIERFQNSTMRAPVSEVKLEPLVSKKRDEIEKPSMISQLPSENIRSRLSSGSSKNLEKKKSREELSDVSIKSSAVTNSVESTNHSRKASKESIKPLSDEVNGEIEYEVNDITSRNLELLPQKPVVENKNLLLQSRSGSVQDDELHKMLQSNDNISNSDTESEVASDDSHEATDLRLNRMSNQIDSALETAERNDRSDFEKKLGTYCHTVITDVKKCSRKIKHHKESIKMYKDDTNKLLDTFNETKSLEDKLKRTFLSTDKGDLDFLNDILKDSVKPPDRKKSNHKTNIHAIPEKPSRVSEQDKNKLLATLRAIDNGDNEFEQKHSTLQNSSKLMNELFTDVSDI